MLGGLTTLNVQIEPLDADAEHDGLDRSELREDVASAFDSSSGRR
jgi:hypothetical protein